MFWRSLTELKSERKNLRRITDTAQPVTPIIESAWKKRDEPARAMRLALEMRDANLKIRLLNLHGTSTLLMTG